jgi:hypothetical protein
MAINRVNKDDLAWMMGYRWSHWFNEPEWNPETGWFKGGEEWVEPTDPQKQEEILNLIKNAHNNPEYWRRKYAEVKEMDLIHNKGIARLQMQNKKYRDQYYELYFKTFKGRKEALRHWWWSNWTFKLKPKIKTWLKRQA